VSFADRGLALVQSATSHALAQNPELIAQLPAYAGQVVRLTTYSPYFSVYICVQLDGINLVQEYEGDVDGRVTCASQALVWALCRPSWFEQQHEPFFTIPNRLELTHFLFQVMQAWDLLGLAHAIYDELLAILPGMERANTEAEQLAQLRKFLIERLQTIEQRQERLFLQGEQHQVQLNNFGRQLAGLRVLLLSAIGIVMLVAFTLVMLIWFSRTNLDTTASKHAQASETVTLNQLPQSKENVYDEIEIKPFIRSISACTA